VGAAIAQGKKFTANIKHANRPARHLDNLALAGRDFVDGGDNVFSHNPVMSF
jgi:hypothetical protein